VQAANRRAESPKLMQYNIRTLQVFESVFRNSSLVLAARELGITASAVSHQLRSLREQVGEDLIVKTGKTVMFTEKGRELAESLRFALSEIDMSVRRAVGSADRSLRVMMCSCFGQGWLIRKLQQSSNPNWPHKIQIKMYAETDTISDSAADVFFSNDPLRDGYWHSKILDETLISVCSSRNAQLQDQLVFITHSIAEPDFGEDWSRYLSFSPSLEATRTRSYRVVGASHYIFALEMAISSVGIALVPDFLAEEALKDGRLRLWSDVAMPSGRSYFMNIKHARRQEKAIQEFSAWVRRAAKA